MCLSSKPPAPPAIPPMPPTPPTPATLADPAVATARRDSQSAEARRTGFAGTRLTSGLGGTGMGGAQKLGGAV